MTATDSASSSETETGNQAEEPANAVPARAPGLGLLRGKKGLVVGVANHRSIAWGVARNAAAEGAELAFTYQGDALERRVRPLAAEVGSEIVEPLDVTNADQIASVFGKLEERWGHLDFLVHSVAYADREELKGRTIDTSRDGFLRALEISAYSLISLTRAAEPLLRPGGSVVAMTYYGSIKVAPSYNVMGIAKAALESSVRYLAADVGPAGVRVNALSAGPIKTLAASGVAGLRSLLGHAADRSSLKRNVTIDDVGKAAVYLVSDLSSGVTGEIHYVDGGLSTSAY